MIWTKTTQYQSLLFILISKDQTWTHHVSFKTFYWCFVLFFKQSSLLDLNAVYKKKKKKEKRKTLRTVSYKLQSKSNLVCQRGYLKLQFSLICRIVKCKHALGCRCSCALGSIKELAKVCRQFGDAITFSIIYVGEDETHIYE